MSDDVEEEDFGVGGGSGGSSIINSLVAHFISVNLYSSI
jgi:hypothetical protein